PRRISCCCRLAQRQERPTRPLPARSHRGNRLFVGVTWRYLLGEIGKAQQRLSNRSQRDTEAEEVAAAVRGAGIAARRAARDGVAFPAAAAGDPFLAAQ